MAQSPSSVQCRPASCDTVGADRVRTGRSLQAQAGLVAGAINTLNPALATQLRAAWEGANNRWNQWVLNYSRGQQMDLLKALGFGAPSWQDLTTTLILLLCTAALAGATWVWWDRRRIDPWQRLQQRVAQRLSVLGVVVAQHHAPRARAALVRQALGTPGEPVALALDALDRQRYGAKDRTTRAADPRSWWRDFDGAVRAVTTR